MKLGNHHGQIIAEIGKLNDFHTKSSWGIIWANFFMIFIATKIGKGETASV